MTTYGLRYRFHSAEHIQLPAGQDDLDLGRTPFNQPIRLTVRDCKRPRGFCVMVIRAGGFPTSENAWAMGQDIRDALLLTGLELRAGIDVGNDRVSGGLSRYAKDKIKSETGVQVLDDVHGLQVYEETGDVKFAGVSTTVTVSMRTDRFTQAFSGSLGRRQLSPKQSLALELVNLAHYESTPRSRALVLISAVEVLAVPQERSREARSFLNSLAAQVRQSLSGAEAQQLKNAILALKREGIRSACKHLVCKHLGEKEAKLFGKLYGVRCEIIHGGKPNESLDLRRYASEVEDLVQELLTSMLL